MKLAGAMALAALAACAIQPVDPGAPGVAGCPKYAADPVKTGANSAPLAELSGLAASATHPGVYWAHNDSGNAFELYAIQEDGTVLATYALTGARMVDTEDVAVAPCAAGVPGSCIWLGDIGDNDLTRTSARLYRIPEPATLASGTLTVEVLNYTYPSGPRDCESLFVDRGAVPYVVTKTAGSLGEVYRLENLSSVGRAVLVTTLQSGGADHTSGAALHPSGERLALRTATHVFEYRSAGAQTVADLLATTPVDLPQGSQPQAEAIAYTPDGLGYLMGSEGAGAPLYREDCATP